MITIATVIIIIRIPFDDKYIIIVVNQIRCLTVAKADLHMY